MGPRADGTVTAFVAEMIGEPITVDVVEQRDQPAGPDVAQRLAIDVGALVTDRRVVAVGRHSGKPAFCAASKLRFELLPVGFDDRLRETPAGLGVALEACGVATERDMLSWGTGASPPWAIRRGLATPALTRTYRFLTGDQPFAVVTEWFALP